MEGITPEIVPLISDIPELAETLGENGNSINWEEMAADHYQLFGMNVYPYESCFLEPERNPGADVSRSVLEFYSQSGFQSSNEESPDHIAVELELLGFLTNTERNYLLEGNFEEVEKIRAVQVEFIDRHLVYWLPQFVFAVSRQNIHPLYNQTAELMLDVILEQRKLIGGGTDNQRVELPPVPKILEDSNTGLRDIVTFLLTPVYSGFFLSHKDIVQLGKQMNIPHGFGDRQQVLLNLLRNSINFDNFGVLLSNLIQIIEDWKIMYQQMEDSLFGSNNLNLEWLARLENTRQLVLSIKEKSA